MFRSSNNDPTGVPHISFSSSSISALGFGPLGSLELSCLGRARYIRWMPFLSVQTLVASPSPKSPKHLGSGLDHCRLRRCLIGSKHQRHRMFIQQADKDPIDSPDQPVMLVLASYDYDDDAPHFPICPHKPIDSFWVFFFFSSLSGPILTAAKG